MMDDDFSKVEIQNNYDDEKNDKIDLSENGEDDFDFNAEEVDYLIQYRAHLNSGHNEPSQEDQENTLVGEDKHDREKTLSPQPTDEWADVRRFKDQHRKYRGSDLPPPVALTSNPALPQQPAYQPPPQPIHLPSQNLSTIHEETRNNNSTVFSHRLTTPLKPPVNMRRTPLTDRNAQMPYQYLVSPKDTSHISNTNATQQNMTAASYRNATTTHNQSSFSATRLAELDAKFQHLRVPIERMNIDEVMSQIKSSQQAASSRPSRFSPAKVNNITASPKFKTPYQASFTKPGPSHTTLATPMIHRNESNMSEAISEPFTQKSYFISVDKPVLAFGFVANKTSRSLSIKIMNESDMSLWLQPTVVQHFDPQSKVTPQTVFLMSDKSSFSLEPRSSHTLTVIFEPKAVLTYNGQLRLKLMSKDEPEFVIRMFGYGSRAELKVCTRSFEKIEMGADGVGICEIERSAKQIELVLVNKGQRDAFAHIYAVDINDKEMSEDLVSVSPCRVVVQKSTKEYVKFTVTFHSSLSSMSMYRTRSNSQMSINTAHTTRTLHNESMGRLRIVWGEERLRRRLKTYLENKPPNGHVPLDLMNYVQKPYRNEGVFHSEKIVGRWDLERFTDSIRVMTIHFIDMHIRQHTQPNNQNGATRPHSSLSSHSINNQSLAQTMAASQLTSQLTSMFSSTTNEDDTMPLYGRQNRGYY